ncbi:MAG: Lipoteichoic acid synthase 2 [Candidatus Izimaplasma bacterium HR2]|nr:MAG: Lipoteichoic acid synthase 2 [Candidatus Izimaplasma bacterium HR2]
MELSQKQITRFMMWGLSMLLLIRLVFFLQDGSNDIIELFLVWLIFFLSLAIIGYIICKDIVVLKDVFMKYKDKSYIFFLVILLEFGFLIENKLDFNYLYIFSILFMIFLVTIFSLILPKTISKIFDIVFILFYGSYVFAQDYYYRIFSDFFSFKEYGTVNEGLEFADGMYEFTFLHAYIILVTLVILAIYLIPKNRSHLEISLPNLKLISPYLIILFVLINLNAQFPVNLARLHLSDHYLYSSTFSREKFVSRFGTLNLLVKDGAETLTPSFTTKRDIEYIDNYYENNIKLHNDNEYTGIFEGKNLIFIIGESFDSIAVNEELTPNIYRLKSEGIDLQNHFTPVFPRTTCDSEIIFNTSIIPSINDGPTCYVYNGNNYSESLATLFNNEDYATAGFHNNYKEFYTRQLVYSGLGYDNFYGQHELGLSETEKRYDSVFFEKTLDFSIPEGEKFFSSILTISGHSPYEMSNLAVAKHYDEVDNYYGDTMPESIKLFVASQMETDVLIGDLFIYLEEKGILDDTVIVLTNDHYPYALDQDDYMEYKGIEEQYEKSRGVMYIWANNIEHVEVTKLTSSFDFVPTIVNLFNLDGNYSYYVGNDIFSYENETIVYFKDFTIFNGIELINISHLEEEENEEIILYATEYYELCEKLLKVDYFDK